MLAAVNKVETTALLNQAKSQAPGHRHEMTKIVGATVYLIR